MEMIGQKNGKKAEIEKGEEGIREKHTNRKVKERKNYIATL
jgi:hypothetical protein